jgi:ADP-ribose pyrophosphatase
VIDKQAEEEILWQGRFMVAKRRGQWEYVSRARGISAAILLAIDDAPDGRHILLVEQFRVPLGQMCLEFPAGLVGDETAGEDPLAAAGRELMEETGYCADMLENLGQFFSSPGLVSEAFTLVRATGLHKIGAGGGVDGEDIIVHRIALSHISAFIAAKRKECCAIDVRLTLLLGLL